MLSAAHWCVTKDADLEWHYNSNSRAFSREEVKKVQHHCWNIINPQMNQPTSQNHPSKLHRYQATERPSRAATVDPHVSQVGERRLCSFFLVISLNRLEGLKVLVRFRGFVLWYEIPCLGRSSPGWDARKIEVCRITHDPRASINGRIPFQVPWHAIVLNRSPTKTAAHQKQFNILGRGDHGCTVS